MCEPKPRECREGRSWQRRGDPEGAPARERLVSVPGHPGLEWASWAGSRSPQPSRTTPPSQRSGTLDGPNQGAGSSRARTLSGPAPIQEVSSPMSCVWRYGASQWQTAHLVGARCDLNLRARPHIRRCDASRGQSHAPPQIGSAAASFKNEGGWIAIAARAGWGGAARARARGDYSTAAGTARPGTRASSGRLRECTHLSCPPSCSRHPRRFPHPGACPPPLLRAMGPAQSSVCNHLGSCRLRTRHRCVCVCVLPLFLAPRFSDNPFASHPAWRPRPPLSCGAELSSATSET